MQNLSVLNLFASECADLLKDESEVDRLARHLGVLPAAVVAWRDDGEELDESRLQVVRQWIEDRLRWHHVRAAETAKVRQELEHAERRRRSWLGDTRGWLGRRRRSWRW